MSHLDEEQVTLAGTSHGVDTLSASQREHLDSCAACRERIHETRRLATALQQEEATVRAPSFDALVAPRLSEEPEPVPDLSARAAWRLTVAVVLRQARLVPGLLWPLTVLGFAVLLGAMWLVPDPQVVSVVLGPGVTLLVTLGALAVCEPRGNPSGELWYAMRVPPVAVWLARLAFVTGADLAMAVGVSLLTTVLVGAAQSAGALIGTWLGPALLGVALTVFGTVWRSPLVGAVFGLTSWLMLLIALPQLGGQRQSVMDHVVVAVWSTNPGTLAVAAVLLAGASWLVIRPGRNLDVG